jgi:2-hydroxy-6-oxonona-2,4-dienedioate hydrolase
MKRTTMPHRFFFEDPGGPMQPSGSRGGNLMRRSVLIAVAGAAAAMAAATTVSARPARVAGKRIMSDRSPFLRSTSVSIGDETMHTLISTAGSGCDALPVVLVHGLALSGQYMVPVADVMAPHHPIYIPDFPGFGDSSKPAQLLDVPGLADRLARWMPAAGLERAVLLGNSFGCQIIADFASRYPHFVQAAVLQGPTTPAGERSWLQQFIRWRQNSPFNPPRMEDIADIDYAKCGYARALGTFHHSLRDRIEDKLPHVAAHTLVVRGEKDPICNQEWAERVARELPRGELIVIPDVAHTLVFTSGKELFEASRAFIDAAA